jgi:hypothetical protein
MASITIKERGNVLTEQSDRLKAKYQRRLKLHALANKTPLRWWATPSARTSKARLLSLTFLCTGWPSQHGDQVQGAGGS